MWHSFINKYVVKNQLLNANFNDSKRLLRYRYGTAQHHGVGTIIANVVLCAILTAGSLWLVWARYNQQKCQLWEGVFTSLSIGVLAVMGLLFAVVLNHFKHVTIIATQRLWAINGIVISLACLLLVILLPVVVNVMFGSVVGYFFVIPQLYLWWWVHKHENTRLVSKFNSKPLQSRRVNSVSWQKMAFATLLVSVTLTKMAKDSFFSIDSKVVLSIIALDILMLLIVVVTMNIQFSQWAEAVLLAYYMCQYPEEYRQHLRKSPVEYYGEDWEARVKDFNILASIRQEQANYPDRYTKRSEPVVDQPLPPVDVPAMADDPELRDFKDLWSK